MLVGKLIMLALALLCAGVAGEARAADPQSWASSSGSCSPDDSISWVHSPTQQVARAAGLVRLRVTGSAFTAYGPFSGHRFGSGDVAWTDISSVAVGSDANFHMTCQSVASWDATFYDIPTAPTNFSGRSTPDGGGGGTSARSAFTFKVPAAGQYVADVAIDQGAVQIGGTTLASSGRVGLGTLGSGEQALAISPLEGPPVSWTVRISALPVVLSAVKTDVAYARVGNVVKVGYTVSGDTKITATVLDAAGAPVRTLATGVPAAMGERTLTWDARGTGGSTLPDGVYAISVSSTDPQGAVSIGSAQVTIDSSGPAVSLASPAEVRPDQAVVVDVVDPRSGADEIAADLDPDEPAQTDPFAYSNRSSHGLLRDATPQFTVSASGGAWSLGRHVLRVYASDKAGNVSARDLVFAVKTNPRPVGKWKACGNVSARKVYKLRTLGGPACSTAKRVAERAAGRRKATVSGYACSRTRSAYTCRRPNKLIRWDRRRS